MKNEYNERYYDLSKKFLDGVRQADKLIKAGDRNGYASQIRQNRETKQQLDAVRNVRAKAGIAESTAFVSQPTWMNDAPPTNSGENGQSYEALEAYDGDY